MCAHVSDSFVLEFNKTTYFPFHVPIERHGPLVNGLREVMEKELEFFVKEER